MLFAFVGAKHSTKEFLNNLTYRQQNASPLGIYNKI